MTTDSARNGQARRAGVSTNGTTSRHTAPAPRLSATNPTRWSFTAFASAFQVACSTADPRTAALTATERPDVAAIGGSLGDDRQLVVPVARGASARDEIGRRRLDEHRGSRAPVAGIEHPGVEPAHTPLACVLDAPEVAVEEPSRVLRARQRVQRGLDQRVTDA